MKKIISLLSVCIASLLLFAGCGVEGSSQAVGIKFVREVFYVDYNVSTFLDLKVYPSTAKNVFITYDIESDSTLDDTFEFMNGAIKVTDAEYFPSVIVKAKMNTLEDSCLVKLREYPESVSLGGDTTLDAGLVKNLDLKGAFQDGDRTCGNGEFIYKVTSTNPSIIEVVSEEELMIRSTGRSGESDIEVTIYNSAGQEMKGLNDKITVTVVESIDSVYATFGNKFVMKDGQTVDLIMPEGVEEKISVRYFSDKNYLIDLSDFDIFLSNNNVFEVVKKADGTYLKLKQQSDVELNPEGKAEVLVTLKSKTTNNEGSVVKLHTTLRVQFL